MKLIKITGIGIILAPASIVFAAGFGSTVALDMVIAFLCFASGGCR